MLRGVDISAVQGTVSFADVKAMGCRFVICKGGEGNRPGPDPRFKEHVAGSRAAGLIPGVYQFVYPLPPDGVNAGRGPVEQAQHHFDITGGFGSHDGELPPLIDAEWPEPQDWAKWGCNAAQIRGWLLAYLDEMTTLCGGRKPLVYTYPDWASHVGLASEPRFASYGLWLASYRKPATWPDDGTAFPAVAPWTNTTFWQVSGRDMRLPNGVPVDCDVFNGGEAELANLARIPMPSGVSPIRVDGAFSSGPPPPETST